MGQPSYAEVFRIGYFVWAVGALHQLVARWSVELMSELKIRIETDEWVYEEYVEA